MALQRQPNDFSELMQIAVSTGLNEAKLRKRLQDKDDPAFTRLDRDLKTVKKIGINSTPTYYLIVNGKIDTKLGPNDVMDALSSNKYKPLLN